MKWVLSRTSYDFVLIKSPLHSVRPNAPKTHPFSVGRSARFVVEGKMKKSPRACFSPSLGLPADRRPRAPSLAAQRSLRGTNAPKDPRRSPRVATRRSSRSRDASRGRSASRLRRTRARNPRRGSIGNRARGSSAARPGRHPRTPALDTRRARARRSGRTPRD